MIILIIMVAGGSSCKKTLELDAAGFVVKDSAIRSEADLFPLINSGYFAIAEDNYYGGSFQVYNELMTDHIDGSTLGGNYLAIYNRNVNIFNSDVSTFYAQMSKPVYQANLVLDNINLASAANKDGLMGQAKFIRSLAWFDLVRMYAQPYTVAGAATTPGIPLRLNSDRQKVSRQSVAEVYAQIILGLKDAENLLPATNGVYATKWSAKALLARVYFQMNDFPNAYLYANDVITNGGFTFDPSVFKRYSSTGTPETIFGLVYEANNTQGRFQRLRNNYNTIGTTIPTLRLTDAFFARATANSTDTRLAWYHKVNNLFNLLGKFDTASVKLPVIHLTELKLIRAEAAAETGQNLSVGISDMNDILTRAYGATSSLLLPSTANATVLKEAARRERELELVGEGNWLQELKRRGAKGEAVTIRGAAYDCPGMIFPFPNNEVIYSAPGFVQNPIGGCN